jgi:hypothetical protein
VASLQRLADLYKGHLDEAVDKLAELEKEMRLVQESANAKLGNFKEKIGASSHLLSLSLSVSVSLSVSLSLCLSLFLSLCLSLFLSLSLSLLPRSFQYGYLFSVAQQEEVSQLKREKTTLEEKVQELEGSMADLQALIERMKAQHAPRHGLPLPPASAPSLHLNRSPSPLLPLLLTDQWLRSTPRRAARTS